jgi:hypothetical protein
MHVLSIALWTTATGRRFLSHTRNQRSVRLFQRLLFYLWNIAQTTSYNSYNVLYQTPKFLLHFLENLSCGKECFPWNGIMWAGLHAVWLYSQFRICRRILYNMKATYFYFIWYWSMTIDSWLFLSTKSCGPVLTFLLRIEHVWAQMSALRPAVLTDLFHGFP